MCHFEIENTQWLTTMPSHHTPPRACKSTLQLPVQCWSHFAFSNSRKKVWHGVVWGCSIDQASSLVVNKPAGDAFSILHILVEVFLPVSTENIDVFFQGWFAHTWKETNFKAEWILCTLLKFKESPHLVTFSLCPFMYMVASSFSWPSPGRRSVSSNTTPW